MPGDDDAHVSSLYAGAFGLGQMIEQLGTPT